MVLLPDANSVLDIPDGTEKVRHLDLKSSAREYARTRPRLVPNTTTEESDAIARQQERNDRATLEAETQDLLKIKEDSGYLAEPGASDTQEIDTLNAQPRNQSVMEVDASTSADPADSDAMHHVRVIIREKPELSIQLTELENRFIDNITIPLSMNKDEEEFYCTTMPAIIQVLEVMGYKPDSLDTTDEAVRQSIMSTMTSS